MRNIERKMRCAVRLLAIGLLITVPSEARAQTPAAAPCLVVLGTGEDAQLTAERQQAEVIVSSNELSMDRRLEGRYRSRLIDRIARGVNVGAAERDTEALPDVLATTSSDLAYTPIRPCRVADTRVAGGRLELGAPRSLRVAGSEGFAAQGGNTGGCGVPLGPTTVVAVNITAVGPLGLGHLRAWSAADSPADAPRSSVLNFGQTPGLPAIANAVIVPICDPAIRGNTCESDFWIEAFGSTADVVVDVLGYFRRGENVLIGASDFAFQPVTGGTLHLAVDSVAMPRYVECNVTCSVTIRSEAANSSGEAYVQAGAAPLGGGSCWGGPAAWIAPVAVPGASAATTTGRIGFGPFEFRMGCYVAGTGDFVGDQVAGAVSWVCQ